jgi:hypothetical protein
MSEDKWGLLQGLAHSRGYEVVVNGPKFVLEPRVKLSRNRALAFSRDLSEEGILAASTWLQTRRKAFNPWPFH